MSAARASERVEAQVRAVLDGVVERVLGPVAAVREAALTCFEEARSRGVAVRRDDLHALREPLQELLLADDCVPVGLGVIVAPSVVDEQPLFLEWWQRGPGTSPPTRLEVDLNTHSVGFYDYVAAPWYAVPRRTRLQHVVGPYVDVHGTDRYVLTFTQPVLSGDEFLGVAGADVPVGRFESLVLHELGDLPAEVVVVGDDDRVVLSTSSRWLVGSLRHDADSGATPLPGLPWRLLTWPTRH